MMSEIIFKCVQFTILCFQLFSCVFGLQSNTIIKCNSIPVLEDDVS